MPIQQREIYLTMWKNLTPNKQETMIKIAINKIDEFSSLCFVDMEKELNELHLNNQLNLLEPIEKMFRLVIVMSKPPASDKNELKSYCFDRITELQKSMGPSNFIWSSIACNVKNAFSIEYFFMNLMIQQLDALYFKTYVINQLVSDQEDDKKKLKKKKNKRKKHKAGTANNRLCNSFVEDNEKIEKIEHRSQQGSHKSDTMSYTITEGGTGLDKMGFEIDIENNLPLEGYIPKPSLLLEAEKLSNNNECLIYGDNNSNKKAITTTPLNRDSINDNIEHKSKAKKNSTFMKKDSKVKEQYNDDSLKITDDKLSSLNNYVLVDEHEKHLIKEPVNFGFDSQITIENSDEDRRQAKNNQNYDTMFNQFSKGGFNNINKFSEYGYREKKPISCIDKDPFTVEIEKRTSSTDFNKKQEFNQRYRNVEDYNSISINKTISTKAESRRLKVKKDPKNIDMNIPFNLKEINKNNSEVEEEGFCNTPLDSKRNQSDINDDYQKNKSTEHNKKNYYGNSKIVHNSGLNASKILNGFSKIDTKQKKPKLKKIIKETRQNTEKKTSSQTLEKNNQNDKLTKTKQIDKLKKVSNADSAKNNKVGGQTTKMEPNAPIKAITYWKDEPSIDISLSPDKQFEESIISMKTIEKNLECDNEKPLKGNREQIKLRKKGNDGNKTSKTVKKLNTNTSLPNKTTKIEIGDERSLKYADNKHMPNEEEALGSISKKSSEKLEDMVKRVFNKVMDEHLDRVISDLEAYTRSLEESRRIIHERISSIIERTFQGENIYVQEYGSYATRLLTPYSDMDLSIQGCIMLDREQAVEMLQVVCDNLKLFSFVRIAVPILTALVPVVKVEADPSIEFEDSEVTKESFKIKIDIIVDLMDDYNPVSTALRTTEYIKYCISTYPSFYKNMLFLKFALNCNDMTNSYKGGLNAYGLCILYVAYMEFYNIENSNNQFELLLGFLNFLTSQFSPETQAVYFGTALR